jgi:hypothetical protein
VSGLGPGLRHDPVLGAYLVFALGVTAFDVLILALSPFAVGAARHLQERVTPYTGWVPSMCYAFSLYSAFSALRTGNARERNSVLLMPAIQAVFGVISWFGMGGARASENPFLQISSWRPLWTIALPLVWLALLVAFKPRSTEAAPVATAEASRSPVRLRVSER